MAENAGRKTVPTDPSASAHDARVVSRARSRAVAWISAVSAVTAAAVFGMAMLMPQETEASAAPAPLVFDDAEGLEQIVSEADDALAADSGPTEPERSASVASWALSEDDATFAPRISVLSWEGDLSGEQTVFESVPSEAGVFFASEETASQMRMAEGEFESPFVEAPGESRVDMLAMLRAYGMPENAGAFDAVRAISAALDQWTLTNAQHSMLIAIVYDAGDAEAVGDSIDRLGRTVTGIQAPSTDAGTTDVLLISTETGRIVGVEMLLLPDADPDSTAALVEYRMWDVDAGVRR